MNKKLIILPAILALVVIACGETPPAAPPDQPGVETIVAATLQAVTQEAANNPPPPAGTSVSFQNVSLVIPSGLASGANGELIPAVDESEGGPWGVAPEYVQFTLTGYPVPSEGFEPVIRVYPAGEYAEANPWAEGSITRLQAILASPSMELTNDNLPTIPFNGAAAQQYAAQAKFVSFQGGNGVRMVSQYSQFPGPITRDNSFYHYEGLTGDGKYLVAVMFPVVLPLQSTSDNPSADGVIYPSDLSDVEGLNAYVQGITDKLNAASPESFQPNLALLDELISSISVLEK